MREAILIFRASIFLRIEEHHRLGPIRHRRILSSDSQKLFRLDAYKDAIQG